jgi:hypothetical protein
MFYFVTGIDECKVEINHEPFSAATSPISDYKTKNRGIFIIHKYNQKSNFYENIILVIVNFYILNFKYDLLLNIICRE